MSISVALAGNPNSGKTSIFNALTGAHQHIGNYPGVTVDITSSDIVHKNKPIHLVDLPGIYSLTSFSQEEIVARKFLVEEKPMVVVDIIDASNLERNLYLTIQLLEMGMNLVIVLNMMDEVQKKDMVLDVAMMSRRLGCPVVEMIGSRSVGLDALKDAIIEAAEKQDQEPIIQYQGELGEEVAIICKLLLKIPDIPYRYSFAAIKLLEQDPDIIRLFSSTPMHPVISSQVHISRLRLERLYGNTADILIGDRRYGFASGLVREITIREATVDRFTMTEQIDGIVTHRYLGLPIFLVSMYLIFWLTFTLGQPPMEWIELAFAWMKSRLAPLLPDGIFQSLLLDGILAGVGGVIVFLPNIVLLFAGISFLEDTGYMARIAFIMDKIMHKIGLHGRSFIPLIIGFGCTVPAIMATRTIRSEKGRLTTMMILPLMSCGARLPIYLMIIPAFFPESQQAVILWILYMIGTILAMGIAKLLRNTLFSGEAEPFIMELPPYRMPSIKTVVRHIWDKSWLYLKKAGTTILGISILLWILLTFPQNPSLTEEDLSSTTAEIQSRKAQASLEYSFAGRIGRSLEPMIAPMGFDWRIGTAFIGAFAAKELFVVQLGIIFALGEASDTPDALRSVLRDAYSPLIGFCIMLFALIATPCIATCAVTRKESGSWKWVLLQWAGLTGLGWIITTLVFQIGHWILH